jgi:hypothetical protein
MLTTIDAQLPGLEGVPATSRRSALGPIAKATAFLDRVDPGTHRRLRLVTSYGIAAMLGTLLGSTYRIPGNALLASLAGGFALWASVSEGQSARALSARDLGLFSAAGVLGALSMLAFAPVFGRHGWPGPELTLVTGSFLVGYLRRFGILGGDWIAGLHWTTPRLWRGFYARHFSDDPYRRSYCGRRCHCAAVAERSG